MRNRLAILTLLTSSLVWGLIWYPYRALSVLGLSGETSSFLTYSIALCLGLVFFTRKLGRIKFDLGLTCMAIAAACANLGYVLGIIHGEVVRVTLLFFLAPIWTLILARILLKEHLTPHSFIAILLSTLGAGVMLWQPSIGLPIPHTLADTLGLLAGIGFALNNVLSRKLSHISIEKKSMATWLGVSVIAGIYSLTTQSLSKNLASVSPSAWGVVFLLGGVIFAVNIIVQYGLHKLPANIAATILLSELIFAAISAYLLEGETLRITTGIGGVLIAVASLLAYRHETDA